MNVCGTQHIDLVLVRRNTNIRGNRRRRVHGKTGKPANHARCGDWTYPTDTVEAHATVADQRAVLQVKTRGDPSPPAWVHEDRVGGQVTARVDRVRRLDGLAEE